MNNKSQYLNRSVVLPAIMALAFFLLGHTIAFGQNYYVPTGTGNAAGPGGYKPSQDFGTGTGSNPCVGCMGDGSNYSADPTAVKAILDSIQVRIQQIQTQTGPVNSGGGAIMAKPAEDQSRALVDTPQLTPTGSGYSAGPSATGAADIAIIRSLLEEILKRLQQLQ